MVLSEVRQAAAERPTLREQNKNQNLDRDYATAIRRLHDLGVMVNASFVFGMDEDDESVFDRTVEWAIEQGIETATFHILTPYPSTALFQRLSARGRILNTNWNLYNARHAVFQPARMTPEALEAGHRRAYRDFYRWGSIFQGAWTKDKWTERLRHRRLCWWLAKARASLGRTGAGQKSGHHAAFAGGSPRFQCHQSVILAAERPQTRISCRGSRGIRGERPLR